MTPAEFKAWFDGFTEAFTGCPTKAQWGRIKDRVSEIDGKPVTERVYVDRYIDRYWRNYGHPWFLSGQGIGLCAQSGLHNIGQNLSYSNSENQQSAAFNGLTAMNALGRAEAGSLS